MIPLKKILEIIQSFEIHGNENLMISYPVEADPIQVNSNSICWVSDKNMHLISEIKSGAIICSYGISSYNPNCTYIKVNNPRLVFKNIISKYFFTERMPFISKHSDIHTSVIIGKNVRIESFVLIEENCIIGDNTQIGSGTIIKQNTTIGNNVKIGSNSTIGGVGFGYEKDSDGNYDLIPHIGNVVICDNVEIGNNSCIDRAVMGSTIINQNVKIDNLVHIAHGVKIGKNSLIIANAMIAGSVEIDENVWVAPSASILNKKTIGRDAVIGMGAVVLKDVKSGQIIIGNPGKILIK